MSSRRTLLLVAMVLIAGAAWSVYARAFDSPFIFDDAFSTTGNSSITKLWPLVGDSQHPGPLNPSKDLPTAGRPLVNLSLALNYHFGQLDPAGYHVFNLIMHVLSAFLVMAIVQRTLCLDYFDGRFQRASGPLAFAVALLWALHPLQTETVVYITQRTELMVSFFYLATLYASLCYWAAAAIAGRITWAVLATLACLAGMACKEVMVTAPVIVLLFERTLIAGSFRQALRESWALYIGLFLAWGLLFHLNYTAPRSESAGFHLGLPAYAWWLTQTKVLLLYLKLAVWPWPLLIHYEMPYLTSPAAAWQWLLPAVLIGIATLVLLWRRNPVGLVGAWVLVILSPTLVVPILTEVAAERRMYLPLAALVTLAVVGGFALAQQWGRRDSLQRRAERSVSRGPVVFASLAAIALGLVLSLVSVRRLAAYHDNLTLWEDAMDYQPDDPVIHTSLSVELTKIGRLQEAMEQCEQALQLNPNFVEAHNNLGLALLKKGRLQEAIGHFQQALQIRPDSALGHNNLGNAFKQAGQLSNAAEQYQNALRLNPDLAEAHINLGSVLALGGRYSDAIEHYQQALRLTPNSSEAHFNLGNALVKTGRPQEAIEHFQIVLRLKPDDLEAAVNLMSAFAEAGRTAQAITAADRALELARSQGNAALVQQIEAWLAKNHSQLLNAP